MSGNDCSNCTYKHHVCGDYQQVVKAFISGGDKANKTTHKPAKDSQPNKK
jgi:hypothetical protein